MTHFDVAPPGTCPDIVGRAAHAGLKRAAFAPDERLILDVSVPQPEDSAAGLKQILAYLEMLREQVKGRDFSARQRAVLEQLYGEKRSWRTALLGDLLRRFADTSDNYSTPPGESEYGRLVALLEEEIGSVREESALLQREEKETSLAERDACLAPEGKQWKLLLREENALDRAIDRKARILNQPARPVGKRRDHSAGSAEPPLDALLI